ncbi:MAG: hypothetical protein HY586_04755, partial [Candidatus Omnitrophica bacterium]|nr:hypothetical protein [Candidatus Omnitrophota bacterium]
IQDWLNEVMATLDSRLRGNDRKGQSSIRSLLEALVEKTGSQPVKMGDHLKAWLRFHLLKEELSAAPLFDEMEGIAESILQKLAITDTERDFLQRWQEAKLLTKLLEVKLSREEYLSFLSSRRKPGSSDFKLLEPESLDSRFCGNDRIFRLALDFYHGASLRDQAMMKNLLAFFRARRAKKAILIAGGFHSDSIKQALRGENISYREIVPAIAPKSNEGYAHLSARAAELQYHRAILNQSIAMPMPAAATMTDHGKNMLRADWVDPKGFLAMGALASEALRATHADTAISNAFIAEWNSSTALGKFIPGLSPPRKRGSSDLGFNAMRKSLDSRFRGNDKTPQALVERGSSYSVKPVIEAPELSSSALSLGNRDVNQVLRRREARKWLNRIPPSVLALIFVAFPAVLLIPSAGRLTENPIALIFVGMGLGLLGMIFGWLLTDLRRSYEAAGEPGESIIETAKNFGEFVSFEALKEVLDQFPSIVYRQKTMGEHHTPGLATLAPARGAYSFMIEVHNDTSIDAALLQLLHSPTISDPQLADFKLALENLAREKGLNLETPKTFWQSLEGLEKWPKTLKKRFGFHPHYPERLLLLALQETPETLEKFLRVKPDQVKKLPEIDFIKQARVGDLIITTPFESGEAYLGEVITANLSPSIRNRPTVGWRTLGQLAKPPADSHKPARIKFRLLATGKEKEAVQHLLGGFDPEEVAALPELFSVEAIFPGDLLIATPKRGKSIQVEVLSVSLSIPEVNQPGGEFQSGFFDFREPRLGGFNIPELELSLSLPEGPRTYRLHTSASSREKAAPSIAASDAGTAQDVHGLPYCAIEAIDLGWVQGREYPHSLRFTEGIVGKSSVLSEEEIALINAEVRMTGAGAVPLAVFHIQNEGDAPNLWGVLFEEGWLALRRIESDDKISFVQNKFPAFAPGEGISIQERVQSIFKNKKNRSAWLPSTPTASAQSLGDLSFPTAQHLDRLPAVKSAGMIGSPASSVVREKQSHWIPASAGMTARAFAVSVGA